MKSKLLLLSFLCFNTFALLGQSNLKGSIKDTNDGPIFFATVALYNSTDSTVVKAASSDENGQFSLENIKKGDYFLKVTMLGYKDKEIVGINLPKDNNKAFDITLIQDAEVLATAEVVGKAPLLEQKSDRLVVNVEGNITGMNGSVLDVMKKVPGMIVVGDKLSMAGQQNITIMINGKTTKYMDMESLLRDMPGDNIKKVEVIHQPGAEFEASGTGAVINIVLKKNNLYGTNGSVKVGLGKGQNWKYKSGVSLSHYQGKLNISGSLGFRNSPFYEELVVERHVVDTTYSQVSKDPHNSKTIRGNLNLDWDVTDRHRLGFNSRIISNNSDNQSQNITNIDFIGKPDLELVTDKTKDGTWTFYTFNPYYTFEIDTNGRKFDIDVNLARFDVKNVNTLINSEKNEGIIFANEQFDQPGLTDIFSSKIDYSHPISEAIKLQIGAKYSAADLDNTLGKFNEVNGTWVKDDQVSNHYLFTENIGAAYAKIDYGKDKWSGTLGLRYENSHSKGFSETLDSTLVRDISKLFPSFSVKRDINKNMATSLAYSYRINRPRYSSLNPFVFSLDPLTSQRGNQNLSPAFTHSMKATMTYQNQPFLSVEYKINNNAMVDVIEQNDVTGAAFKTERNLKRLDVLSTMLAFPLSFIPKLDGYGVFMANYKKYNSEYLDDQFLASKWNFVGYVQVSYVFPLDINAEASAWYDSGSQEGLLNSEHLYGVDFGISKKFLDNKLKVSLGIENAFVRFFHANVDYSNIDLDIISKWDAPVINFQMSYKFGNQFMKNKKKFKSSASEEINRAQQ